MPVSKEEIAEIKSKVNIVDLIGRYMQLSKQGRNYIGLCPFHGEKTPSFSVNAEKGFYHCFGCGRSGDAIRFIEEYKNVDFQSALTEVADIAGISLQFDARTDEKSDPNAVFYEINNQASRIYQTILLSTEIGQEARKYLASRGIDEMLIKQFGIGLAPDEPDFLYQNLKQKFDENVLANSGLFRFSSAQVYDTFQNRLMFPIQNQYSQVIAFSGRRWAAGDERQGKYVNTEATAIFDKSFELYNLNRAKGTMTKTSEVYLVEGFMDVIAAYRAGISNVVAIMGTAFTEKHANRLRQLVKKIVLVTDGDNAGQKAIEKALQLLSAEDVAIVKVPDGMDPDEYLAKNGEEALSALMKSSRLSRSEFLMDYLRPQNLTAVDAQLGFLQQLAPVIAQETSIQAQDIYVRRMVEILPDFEYNQVEETVNSFRENVTGAIPAAKVVRQEPLSVSWQVPADPVFEAQQKLSAESKIEQQLLQRLITHPELIERVSAENDVVFQQTEAKSLYEKLIVEQMATGKIDLTSFADQLTADETTLYYTILGLNLPDELTEKEWTDLQLALKKEQVKAELTRIERQRNDAQRAGDAAKELELTLETVRLTQELQGEKFGN